MFHSPSVLVVAALAGTFACSVPALRAHDASDAPNIATKVNDKKLAAAKQELSDAYLQLKIDKEILARFESPGCCLPEVFRLNARRTVATGQNAWARALESLRTAGGSWKDLETISRQADEIRKNRERAR